mgnify:CR=1 FL=1
MSWAATRQRLNDAVIRAFSTPVTYTVAGGLPVAIEAEFRARFLRLLIDGDGNEINDVRPRLLVKWSLIPDTLTIRPHKNDTFTAEGKTYRVVEVEDSGAGYWTCWGAEKN